MTSQSIILHHLCFTGPQKELASVDFGGGLNVIYGASETGKSFILEALDYMLGDSGDLRDIPERVGYDRIFLGLEFGKDGPFTLERSTAGGDFRCYEGTHYSVPDSVEPEVLKAKHKAGHKNTVSAFLLKGIGLWDKRVRRNARGETNSLSFRNLAHLTLISEGDIQKRISPIVTGQHVSKTIELSVFKLLLSGVDDSAVQPEARDERVVISRAAKVEVIDELLADYKSRLEDIDGVNDREELEDQIGRLGHTLDRESHALQSTEQEYQIVLSRRNNTRKQIEKIDNRRTEINDMLARFSLLDEHYQSDLSRLEGVQEAGSLIEALEPGFCPLCGASVDAQHLTDACDGNIEQVVSAALAEKSKIATLRKELGDTVEKLMSELGRYKEIQPTLITALNIVDQELKGISPDLSERRSVYSELLEKKNEVQNALNLFKSISDLEEKRESMDEAPTQPVSADKKVGDLSSSTLDNFSILMETILQAWEFPDSDRVHFDRESNDLIISGKPRGSRGKGMRAITHAAFTIGLLQYTEENELSHPGFVVLDTPLLAYREPENDEDDLRGTDVQSKFYEFLLNWTSRQVIVLENEDPPYLVKDTDQTIFFSKNSSIGRYGLFPVE
jgi:uncharacterized coiled-coil DUF342 family protein